MTDKHIIFALISVVIGIALLWYFEFEDFHLGKKEPLWMQILIYSLYLLANVFSYIGFL
jgi:hypothetical protein